MKKVLEGSYAIAEAVKSCAPKVIASFPITPQTHIPERLAEMVADGELDAEFLNVESEHSAMAVCIGAQATGVRTFTASSSQGIALMWELLHIASGMRLPIVMAVANRSLSAPLNIWNDWSDSIGCRDTGWIQLYCKDAQEAYDTTIQAYRIAEDVLLPVMVCIDGFFLSHTLEPVVLDGNGFVRPYKPHVTLDPKKPVSQGCYATPEYFQEFKKQQQDAMDSSLDVIQKVNSEYAKKTGRRYGSGLLECVGMKGARYAILTMGTLSGTIEHALEKGVGLVRLRSYRPFPAKELQKALQGVEAVAVLEKDISLGIGGAVWSELRGFIDKPVSCFIGGLGGRDVRAEDIKGVISTLKKKGDKIHWV